MTPAARTYQFVGLAALLVLAAGMYARSAGSLGAAAVPALVGGIGLVFRLQAAPGIALLALAYLLVLPFGVPLYDHPFSDVPRSHFRVLDLLLVGAAVVYFACHFRLASLTVRAMPADAPAHLRAKTDRPPVRPAGLVPEDEVGRLFVTAGLCVLVGQVVWLLVTELRVDFGRTPPVRVGPDPAPPGWVTRFLLLGGLAAAAGGAAGLGFWYWRLARLTPAEGRLAVLDAGWREARRELGRQETWRAWAAARGRPSPARPAPPPEPRPWRVRRLAVVTGVIVAGVVAAGCVIIALLAAVAKYLP